MQIHVIQKGETLWAISKRYGISVDRLTTVNQLENPNLLVIGQSLIIPSTESKHIVQPGESLWLIARRYGTTIPAIIQANNIINPNMITAGQELIIPSGSKPVKEINAYLTRFDSKGEAIVREVSKHLTYLSPFSHSVQSNGSISTLADASIIAAAHSENVAPLLILTNFDGNKFNSDLAHSVLANSSIQTVLINNIISLVRSKGYIGVNIDFEYVYPDDRELYNQFLRNLANRLHPEGIQVSSALAPKLTADQPGFIYPAHDYPVHGQVLGFTVLMTYEWGWAGGPPMAMAPLNMVKRVLDYAVTAIPRDKIMMGMPLYGRDWLLPYVKGGPSAKAISPQEAIRRAAKYGAKIEFDQTAQSPYFHYHDEQGREHEVWFEDARSVQAKFTVVKDYQLRGVSYWVLDIPFPQVWWVQDGNFITAKRV